MDNTHLDHVGEFEFSDIIEVYLNHHDIELIEYTNTDNGTIFKKDSDGFKFKRLHDVLCLLEPVHKKYNLTRGKK
jgi:hypothetical protein